MRQITSYTENKCDSTNPEYFTVNTEESQCNIKPRDLSYITLEKMNMAYIPMNRSIFIIRHKLQGETIHHLVVISQV